LPGAKLSARKPFWHVAPGEIDWISHVFGETQLLAGLFAKFFAKFFADGRGGMTHLVDRPQQLLSAHSEMPRQIFHFICVACVDPAAIRSDFLCQGSRHEAALFTSKRRLKRAMRSAEKPTQAECDGDGRVWPILDRTANDVFKRGRRLSYAFGRIARRVFGLPV